MARGATYRSPDAREGIRAARAARTELGIGLEDPIDDVLLRVEQLELPVAVVDLGEGIAGAYLCRPEGRLVFVNRVHAVQRQRFTVAHELGHHRLDHPGHVDSPADLADFGDGGIEVQANWFAAEFLMPMPAARRWADERLGSVATLEDVVRFACDFGVSAKAACIRLQTAGRLPDEDRCAKLHAEIDGGEHHDLAERLGLDFPVDTLAGVKADGARIPPALQGGAMSRFARGEIDARAVAVTVGRSPAEVRGLALDAGLPLGC
jgi:Zn-dependent peptidase ImmA (M78 family)